MIGLTMGATLATLCIGVPIALVLLSGTLLYFMLAPGPDVIAVQRMVSSLESFPLLAVPFFILTGVIMARGGIALRILALAETLVGNWRGGLAQVNVMNSVLMGGMCGSANADAAVDAKILVPVMTQRGYSLGFSSALSAASGVIAPIIPPGIGMIIYGLVAQVSIGQLFLGGLVPGLLLAVALMIAVRLIAARRGYGVQTQGRPPLREVGAAFRSAAWALGMPVLLLGGLRFGVFTPSELGAVAALYALFIAVVVYRDLPLKDIVSVLRDAVVATSVVMLIIAAGAGFGAVITRERIPQALVGGLLDISSDPVVVLLIINVALLVMGMFFEATALTIVLAPILAPVALALGVDPVHFGVVFVVNLTIGGITPPLGTIMYTVCSITGCKVSTFSREVLPFLGATLTVLMLITYIPSLVLALPNAAFG